ncbi:ubiquitin-like protein 7 isoform X1 [Epargyreus clarus]|uniref:ubiquitin-like protein 7 isoform X1 n=1 Tax=Epargyreus clarus TaxID=520877 RepID=UPI003C2BC7A2
MEAMESQSCVFLGIKVKPGPIERYKIENFTLDNTVDTLKGEAEKKTNLPSASLELIHHGKILKDNATLQDSGVKSGEMVHVVKKKEPAPATPPLTFSDAELQQLNSSLRTLGCTPNAPGWTRAMQLLNDESAMAEIMEHAPSLNDDCVTLSILHEVELLAALGANVTTMRRGTDAHPDLVTALRHLVRLVRSRSTSRSNDNAPISGFAYSLEALSEDEDAEEDEPEEGEGRNAITQEQLAAALQAATEAVIAGGSPGPAAASAGPRAVPDGLLRLLQPPPAPRAIITPEMFSEAITDAISRTGATSNAVTSNAFTSNAVTSNAVTSNAVTSNALTSNAVTSNGVTSNGFTSNGAASPMEYSNTASSSQSQSPGGRNDPFMIQLHHMHEVGLLDDTINVRALLICAGDVNAAINLVFNGVIGED